MSESAQHTSLWQSVKDLPGRTPLWGKLITGLLALVAAALLVISIAGVGFLQSYLLGQADNYLYALASPLNQPAIQGSLATGQPVTAPSGSIVYWLPYHGKLEQISAVHFDLGRHGFGPSTGPQISPASSFLTSGRPTTVAATSGQGRWRVLAVQESFQAPGGQLNGTVIYSWDVTSVYQTTGRLVGVDWIVSAVLLFILAIVGVAVIRASLRPLVDIEKTAGAIAAGDLSRRVPERDPRTEVGRLGRSLNAMLSQIEAAFESRSQSEAAARRSEEKLRQFVADASHELRTPLTAIRGFAEYYRQRGGVDTGEDDAGTAEAGGAPDVAGISGVIGAGGAAGNAPGDGNAAAATGAASSRNGTGQLASADMDRIMRRVEQESSRMGVLVEDMLLLARLDQQRPLDRRPVDLLTLAADAVHDARVVAPSRNINLTVRSGAALLVLGDEVRLRQVIGNLMSNALSHTPDGTPIDVLIRSGNLGEARTASRDDQAVPANLPGELNRQPAAVLEVADHGPGLTREQAEHVFERFYRGDQARTSGGTGLGLAIVAALVTAHGGAAWVRTQPGSGATFCIALPLSPEAAQGANDSNDAAEEADAADAEHMTGEQAA